MAMPVDLNTPAGQVEFAAAYQPLLERLLAIIVKSPARNDWPFLAAALGGGELRP